MLGSDHMSRPRPDGVSTERNLLEPSLLLYLRGTIGSMPQDRIVEGTGTMGSTDSRARKLRGDEIACVVKGSPVGVLAAALENASARLDPEGAERLASCRAGSSTFREAARNTRKFVDAALTAVRSLPPAAQDEIVATILATGAELALGADD